MKSIFDDNPLLVCKCGRKFRKRGIDRNGKERTYTQCMNCTIEDWNKKRLEKAR